MITINELGQSRRIHYINRITSQQIKGLPQKIELLEKLTETVTGSIQNQDLRVREVHPHCQMLRRFRRIQSCCSSSSRCCCHRRHCCCSVVGCYWWVESSGTCSADSSWSGELRDAGKIQIRCSTWSSPRSDSEAEGCATGIPCCWCCSSYCREVLFVFFRTNDIS